MRRRVTGTLVTLVMVGALSACGDESSTQVDLDDQLAAVDAAVVAGDDAATLDALEQLVSDAEAGDLDEAQLDAIRSAATELERRLAEDEAPEPDPEETQEPQEESDGEEDSEEDDDSEEEEDESDEDEDEDEDEKPGKGKGRDKGKKDKD